MNISLSTLKENPAKYFEMAKTADVIVTRRGEPLGRIVSEEKAARSDRRRAIEALIGTVPLPPEYDDPDYDPDYVLLREADYKDRGLL
ncbi:MAG: type II toxin-antitoxin system Phd/YefM family antitoxin [Clostridiales Family XIII bacterium]|jgi:prevent-host-death family protein|nr:type II toxin-antitoxin system Phd/YefM family antitoxin [Clostridiales Family XIII bacterium]